MKRTLAIALSFAAVWLVVAGVLKAQQTDLSPSGAQVSNQQPRGLLVQMRGMFGRQNDAGEADAAADTEEPAAEAPRRSPRRSARPSYGNSAIRPRRPSGASSAPPVAQPQPEPAPAENEPEADTLSDAASPDDAASDDGATDDEQSDYTPPPQEARGLMSIFGSRFRNNNGRTVGDDPIPDEASTTSREVPEPEAVTVQAPEVPAPARPSVPSNSGAGRSTPPRATSAITEQPTPPSNRSARRQVTMHNSVVPQAPARLPLPQTSTAEASSAAEAPTATATNPDHQGVIRLATPLAPGSGTVVPRTSTPYAPRVTPVARKPVEKPAATQTPAVEETAEAAEAPAAEETAEAVPETSSDDVTQAENETSPEARSDIPTTGTVLRFAQRSSPSQPAASSSAAAAPAASSKPARRTVHPEVAPEEVADTHVEESEESPAPAASPSSIVKPAVKPVRSSPAPVTSPAPRSVVTTPSAPAAVRSAAPAATSLEPGSRAKLQLTLEGTPQTHLGQKVIYIATLTNVGTSTAHGIVLNLTLDGNSQNSLDVGDLSAKQARKVQLQIQPVRAGKLALHAIAMAEGGLLASAGQTIEVLNPHLQLVMTGPQETAIDQTTTFDAVVTNSMHLPAQHVNVTIFVNEIRIGEVPVGALPPGGSRQVQVKLKMSQAGQSTWRAVASDSAGHEAVSGGTIDVLNAQLKVALIGPAEVSAGVPSALTAYLSNEGSDAAQNVTLDVNFGAPSQERLFEGTLAPGERKELNFNVQPATAGALKVQAVAKSSSSAAVETVHNMTVRPQNIQVSLTGPAKLTQGQSANLVLIVQNTGKEPTESFIVDVKLGNSQLAGLYNGSLPPGGRQEIPFKASPRATGDVLVSATARVGQQTRSVAKHTVNITPPQVTVKIAGPLQVRPGQTAQYTVTMKNEEAFEITGVTTDVALGNSVLDKLFEGSLPAGETREVAFRASPAAEGELILKAVVQTSRGILAHASETVIIGEPSVQATLSGPESLSNGEAAMYAINVRNVGQAEANNLVASLRLPSDLKFVSGVENTSSTSGLTWSIPTLKPGEEKSFNVRCEALVSGEKQLVLQVSAAGQVVATDITATEVRDVAQIFLNVAEPTGPKPLGEDVVYEIELQNQSSQTARQIDVVVNFADGVSPLRAEGLAAEVRHGQVLFARIDELAGQQSQKLRIVATGERSGGHVYRVEVRCAQPHAHTAHEGTTQFFATERVSLGGSRDEEADGASR